MPRSGTSYVINTIHEKGPACTPSIWASIKPADQKYRCAEPSILQTRGSKVSVKSALDRIVAHPENQSPHELAIKTFGTLDLTAEELTLFSKVVVCTRPVGSWLKSAERHSGVQSFQRGNRYGRSFTDTKEFGEWLEHMSLELIKRCSVPLYHTDFTQQSFAGMWKWLGGDQAWAEGFKGSTCD